MEITLDDFGGNGVLQALLNVPAQVPGAIGGRIGILHQLIQHGFVPGKSQILFLQNLLQLLQHNPGDGAEILLRKLVEADDLIHPVDKLRPQELLQGLHGLVASLLGRRAAEADGAALPVGARIGRHDDDGVFEVTLIKKPKNPMELNEIIASLINLVDDTDMIYSFKTAEVKFTASREIPWTLDGEFGGDHEEVCVKNLKQAVDIMVKKPEESKI